MRWLVRDNHKETKGQTGVGFDISKRAEDKWILDPNPKHNPPYKCPAQQISGAHSNAPWPSREILNDICVLITSAERSCSARKRRKLGYVGGLKMNCRKRMN